MGATAPLMFAQSHPKLKVAVVGTGHRAWILLYIMRQIPDIEVVALADPTPKFLEQAVKSAGRDVRTYAAYDKLFAAEKDLDAAVVVTPGLLHAPVAIAAFERGLHVFCEKPMATTIDDANRMIAAGKKAGKILQLDLQMRYDPVYGRLHSLVKEGRIGTLQYASGFLYRGDWNPESWKTPDKNGNPTVWRLLRNWTGSSIIEDGIHELDVLHWTIDSRVARVYASGGNNVYKGRETIDHAIIAIDYVNGVKLQFGYSLFGLGRDEEMYLIGTEGILKTEKGSIILQRKGSGPEKIEIHDFEQRTGGNPAGAPENPSNLRSITSLVEAVQKQTAPMNTGEVGKEAIKIGLLAQKSIDEGRPMAWTDLPA
jgi:predicted dehydrogenase